MENVQRPCLKFAHFMSFPGDGDCSWEHVARKTLSYPVMCVARYSQADPPLQQLVLLVNTFMFYKSNIA